MAKVIGYIVLGILAIFVAFWAVGLVVGLVGALIALVLKIAIPVLIVGGIGYLIYRAINKNKSISGSNHSYLP